MRGSPDLELALEDAVGIIPAHAGLTVRSLSIFMIEWDHPRACGAHGNRLEDVVAQEGSSPRMRGSRLFFIDRTAS